MKMIRRVSPQTPFDGSNGHHRDAINEIFLTLTRSRIELISKNKDVFLHPEESVTVCYFNEHNEAATPIHQ